MWLLMIMFLHLAGHDHVINDFKTEEACIKERNRIGFEMAESYPWDHDFDVICIFRARVI